MFSSIYSDLESSFSFMAFCAFLWYCTLTEIAASPCSAGRYSNCRRSIWIRSCSSKTDLASSSSHKPQGLWFFKSFVLTFIESVYAGSVTVRLSVLCSQNIKAMFTVAEYGFQSCFGVLKPCCVWFCFVSFLWPNWLISHSQLKHWQCERKWTFAVSCRVLCS